MKKWIAGFLLLALLAGCGQTTAPTDASGPVLPAAPQNAGLTTETDAPALLSDPSNAGLTMEMERPVYDPSVTSFVYLIHNGTEKGVEFGAAYRLQRWEDGGWQDLLKDAAFTSIGYYLSPGGTMALTCWSNGGGKPGDYRLVKEVGGETLYAQFQLGESLYTAETPYGFVPLEALEQLPDLQGAVSPEGGPGDPAEFVWKAGRGVPCQLRLVRGGGAVTDVIYENRHFLLRKLADGQITQARYSYLVTDGRDLLLSNWVEWEEGREAVKLLPEADPEQVQTVQNIMAAQLLMNAARFRIWSEDGEWNAMLTDAPTEFAVEWRKPGEGSHGEAYDLEYLGRTETAILDLSWQADNTLLLTCEAAASGAGLLIFDPQTEQLKSAN